MYDVGFGYDAQSYANIVKISLPVGKATSNAFELNFN